MNTQRLTKSFLLRRGRFSENGPSFDKIKYTKIDFGDSLNSINLPGLFFTNYSSSNAIKQYKIIKNNYKDNVQENDFLHEYVIDEIYSNSEISRLIDIINFQNNSSYVLNDIINIIKLKNKDSKDLHIYVILNNNIIKVLLIDLFHLGIKADLYSEKTGKLIKRADLKELYSKHSSNNYSLCNILSEL